MEVDILERIQAILWCLQRFATLFNNALLRGNYDDNNNYTNNQKKSKFNHDNDDKIDDDVMWSCCWKL